MVLQRPPFFQFHFEYVFSYLSPFEASRRLGNLQANIGCCLIAAALLKILESLVRQSSKNLQGSCLAAVWQLSGRILIVINLQDFSFIAQPMIGLKILYSLVFVFVKSYPSCPRSASNSDGIQQSHFSFVPGLFPVLLHQDAAVPCKIL